MTAAPEPGWSVSEYDWDPVELKARRLKPATTEPDEGFACQVVGCPNTLDSLRPFYQRLRICEEHAKAHSVTDADGCAQRFCQQCSKLHRLTCFEGARRSCIESLLKRKQRRCHSSFRSRPVVEPPPRPLPESHDADGAAVARKRASRLRSAASRQPGATLQRVAEGAEDESEGGQSDGRDSGASAGFTPRPTAKSARRRGRAEAEGHAAHRPRLLRGGSGWQQASSGLADVEQDPGSGDVFAATAGGFSAPVSPHVDAGIGVSAFVDTGIGVSAFANWLAPAQSLPHTGFPLEGQGSLDPAPLRQLHSAPVHGWQIPSPVQSNSPLAALPAQLSMQLYSHQQDESAAAPHFRLITVQPYAAPLQPSVMLTAQICGVPGMQPVAPGPHPCSLQTSPPAPLAPHPFSLSGQPRTAFEAQHSALLHSQQGRQPPPDEQGATLSSPPRGQQLALSSQQRVLSTQDLDLLLDLEPEELADALLGTCVPADQPRNHLAAASAPQPGWQPDPGMALGNLGAFNSSSTHHSEAPARPHAHAPPTAAQLLGSWRGGVEAQQQAQPVQHATHMFPEISPSPAPFGLLGAVLSSNSPDPFSDHRASLSLPISQPLHISQQPAQRSGNSGSGSFTGISALLGRPHSFESELLGDPTPRPPAPLAFASAPPPGSAAWPAGASLPSMQAAGGAATWLPAAMWDGGSFRSPSQAEVSAGSAPGGSGNGSAGLSDSEGQQAHQVGPSSGAQQQGEHLATFSAKLFGATPHNLEPELHAQLQAALTYAPSVMQASIRPGCVCLTASLLLTAEERAAAEATPGGVAGVVAHALAASAAAKGSPSKVLCQSGAQLCAADGATGHAAQLTLPSHRASALRLASSPVVLAPDSHSAGCMKVQAVLVGQGLAASSDTLHCRSRGRHVPVTVLHVRSARDTCDTFSHAGTDLLQQSTAQQPAAGQLFWQLQLAEGEDAALVQFTVPALVAGAASSGAWGLFEFELSQGPLLSTPVPLLVLPASASDVAAELSSLVTGMDTYCDTGIAALLQQLGFLLHAREWQQARQQAGAAGLAPAAAARVQRVARSLAASCSERYGWTVVPRLLFSATALDAPTLIPAVVGTSLRVHRDCQNTASSPCLVGRDSKAQLQSAHGVQRGALLRNPSGEPSLPPLRCDLPSSRARQRLRAAP